MPSSEQYKKKKIQNTKSRKNGVGFFSSSCFYFSTVLAFDPPYYFLCYTAVGGLYDIGMNLSRTVEEWRVIAYITCDNGRLGVVASLYTIVSLLFLKRIPLVYVFETVFSSLSFLACSFFIYTTVCLYLILLPSAVKRRIRDEWLLILIKKITKPNVYLSCILVSAISQWRSSTCPSSRAIPEWRLKGLQKG